MPPTSAFESFFSSFTIMAPGSSKPTAQPRVSEAKVQALICFPTGLASCVPWADPQSLVWECSFVPKRYAHRVFPTKAEGEGGSRVSFSQVAYTLAQW